MKTRITEAFGIKYPVLLSGMSWISVPKMVAAVSNAGGLGILATGPLNPTQTRNAIKEIRSLTDKPFGANATLLCPGAQENAKVLLDEQVPVINFSLGKGDWLVKAATHTAENMWRDGRNASMQNARRISAATGLSRSGMKQPPTAKPVTSLILYTHSCR